MLLSTRDALPDRTLPKRFPVLSALVALQIKMRPESGRRTFKIADGYGGHTQVLALFDRSQNPDYRGTDAVLSTVDHIAFEIPLADFANEKKRRDWKHWDSKSRPLRKYLLG